MSQDLCIQFHSFVLSLAVFEHKNVNSHRMHSYYSELGLFLNIILEPNDFHEHACNSMLP